MRKLPSSHAIIPFVFSALLAVNGSLPTGAATAPLAVVALPCTIPYGARVRLISPAPGSSGVAAGHRAVVVVASEPLPPTVDVVAVDRTGKAIAGAPIQRIAPPPGAPKPFAYPVYYRSADLALRAGHRYAIALDNASQNGCAPYAQIAGDASFST